MTLGEAIDTTRIHSVVGLTSGRTAFVTLRPRRALLSVTCSKLIMRRSKERFRKYEAAGERPCEKNKDIVEEVLTPATAARRSSATVEPRVANRSGPEERPSNAENGYSVLETLSCGPPPLAVANGGSWVPPPSRPQSTRPRL
jgi:hypothetical protein